MNNRRVYFVMIGVVIILAAANFGAVFMANQVLGSKSGRLSELKLESSVLDEQQNSLTIAKKDIDTYSDLEEIAKTVVPQDKDQAAAVREIVNIAASHGIRLASISFPASTLGQTQAPATATSADGTTTPVVKSPVTQVQPVEGIPGVYSLQITVQQDTTSPTTYDNFIGFLSDLEHNRRTAQVSNVTVQPDSGDRSLLTFNLTLNSYIKP